MPLYLSTPSASVTPSAYQAGGRSGIWYGPSLAGFADGEAVALTADDEIAVPFIPRVDGTLDRIGCYVVTGGAAGSVVRIGIRADTGYGFPSGTVLLDAGTFVATGNFQSNEITVAYAVSAGTLYWFTVCGQGSPATQPTVLCFAQKSSNNTIVGKSSLETVTGPHWSGHTAPKQASITGVLPASWTGTDKFSYWPIIGVRFA